MTISLFSRKFFFENSAIIHGYYSRVSYNAWQKYVLSRKRKHSPTWEMCSDFLLLKDRPIHQLTESFLSKGICPLSDLETSEKWPLYIQMFEMLLN